MGSDYTLAAGEEADFDRARPVLVHSDSSYAIGLLSVPDLIAKQAVEPHERVHGIDLEDDPKDAQDGARDD